MQDGEKWDKRDMVLFANMQYFFAAGVVAIGCFVRGALGMAEHIFDGGDFAKAHGGEQLIGRNIAYAYMQNFSFALHGKHRFHTLLKTVHLTDGPEMHQR